MKTRHLAIAASLTAALLLAACASEGGAGMAGQPMPTMSAKSTAGAVLTDQKGMTLYTYDEDTPGNVDCTGMCASAWPPLYAQADAAPSGHFSVVTRPNGSKQWAKDGKPLYTYEDDKKAGDIKGDGLEGAWHIVRPD